MSLLKAVEDRARAAGLKVSASRGAGPLGWDPIDPREAAAAEVVVISGKYYFVALARIGTAYRYLAGRSDDMPTSEEFPFGTGKSLDPLLDFAIRFAGGEPMSQPGK